MGPIGLYMLTFSVWSSFQAGTSSAQSFKVNNSKLAISYLELSNGHQMKNAYFISLTNMDQNQQMDVLTWMNVPFAKQFLLTPFL